MAMHGWAGQILRVNLTNRSITTQSTEPYKPYVGGMGIGYKVLWDEVPLDTDPYSPQAKAVFGVGPLTGSGVPCSGRTNVSFLTKMTRGYSVCDGHVGGHFGNMLKYAGYDALIIEGRSPTPVYIKIDDDRITIESATHLWGRGTRETNRMVVQDCGPEFISLCIGPAGENLVNYSMVYTSWGNIAGGGIGAVLGSKNLKAIAVHGSGGVAIANPQELLDLNNYMLTELIGANNNHNVPSFPQSWAELTAQPMNRWRGGGGHRWEKALGGPVDTGEQPYWEIHRIAYRCNKGHHEKGDQAMKNTVRVGGCSSCPVRCYQRFDAPEIAPYAGTSKVSNTCLGHMTNHVHHLYARNAGDPVLDMVSEGDSRMLLAQVASSWMDDLGLWCNYGFLYREFRWCYENGILRRVLPAAEFNAIPWHLMEAGDPRWLQELLTRIASNQGELARLGDGAYNWTQRWNVGNEFWDAQWINAMTYNGYPQHHDFRQGGQAAIFNVMYNRDCMVHTIANPIETNMPFHITRGILESHFGTGCLDQHLNFTPVNAAKIRLGKWAFNRKQWHDMSTLCDWMWPMTTSPSAARGYSGDIHLDAKYMTAITGENWTNDDVLFAAERVSQMLRAMTTISFNLRDGVTNMRQTHDRLNTHYFDRTPHLEPFTPGNSRMVREDMERTFDMFYDAMGWDRVTGIPTRATLTRFGLGDMADKLAQLGILPS